MLIVPIRILSIFSASAQFVMSRLHIKSGMVCFCCARVLSLFSSRCCCCCYSTWYLGRYDRGKGASNVPETLLHSSQAHFYQINLPKNTPEAISKCLLTLLLTCWMTHLRDFHAISRGGPWECEETRVRFFLCLPSPIVSRWTVSSDCTFAVGDLATQGIKASFCTCTMLFNKRYWLWP